MAGVTKDLEMGRLSWIIWVDAQCGHTSSRETVTGLEHQRRKIAKHWQIKESSSHLKPGEARWGVSFKGQCLLGCMKL